MTQNYRHADVFHFWWHTKAEALKFAPAGIWGAKVDERWTDVLCNMMYGPIQSQHAVLREKWQTSNHASNTAVFARFYFMLKVSLYYYFAPWTPPERKPGLNKKSSCHIKAILLWQNPWKTTEYQYFTLIDDPK